VFSIRCSKEQRISKILLPSFFGGKILRGTVEPLQNYENPWGNLHVKNRCQDGRGNGAGEATAGKSLIFNSCISSGLQLFQRTSSQPVPSLASSLSNFQLLRVKNLPAVTSPVSPPLPSCYQMRVSPTDPGNSAGDVPGAFFGPEGKPQRTVKNIHRQTNMCTVRENHVKPNCGIQVTWK